MKDSKKIKHPWWLIAAIFFIILGLVHWGPFGIIIGIVCFAVWAQKEFKS